MSIPCHVIPKSKFVRLLLLPLSPVRDDGLWHTPPRRVWLYGDLLRRGHVRVGGWLDRHDRAEVHADAEAADRGGDAADLKEKTASANEY